MFTFFKWYFYNFSHLSQDLNHDFARETSEDQMFVFIPIITGFKLVNELSDMWHFKALPTEPLLNLINYSKCNFLSYMIPVSYNCPWNVNKEPHFWIWQFLVPPDAVVLTIRSNVDERHRTNQQIHDTRYQLNELQQWYFYFQFYSISVQIKLGTGYNLANWQI